MSEQLEPDINKRYASWDTQFTVFLYEQDSVVREHKGDEIGRLLREAGFVAIDGRPLHINLPTVAAGGLPEPPEGRMLEMDGGEAHVQWRRRVDLSLIELRLSFSSEPGDSTSLLREGRFTVEVQQRLVGLFTELCCLPGFECGGNLLVPGEADQDKWYNEAFESIIEYGRISLERMVSSVATMIWSPLFLGRRFVQRLAREKLLRCPGRPVLSPTEDVVCIYVVPFDPCLVLPDEGPRAGAGIRVTEYLHQLVLESQDRETGKNGPAGCQADQTEGRGS